MASRKKKRKEPKRSLGVRLLNLAGHSFCFVMIVFLFLTLVQCTIKKPEAPTFDTNLVVPLTNKTWDMEELIEKIDQENLTIDSTGNPVFFYETTLDTIIIDASFTIDDVSASVAESLGVIALDPFSDMSETIALSDYIDPAILASGIIPDTGFTITTTLDPFGDYSSATISVGELVSTIVNDFGIDLDTVNLTILDAGNGNSVVTTSQLGAIPAGSSTIDTTDLAGQTISNQLALEIYCHTVATTTFASGNPTLSAGVGMPSGLQVSSATAAIPRQSRDFTEAVSIDSDHLLQRAILSSGSLALSVTNNTALEDTVTITLPDIKNLSDQVFTITQVVAPYSSINNNYPLTGYTLEPVDQVLPQDISVEAQAIVNSSGALVTIDADDNIAVSAGITGLALSSVEGIIGQTTADFDDIQEEIDVPTGLEAVQLPAAVLTLEIINTVNIPGSLYVEVNGDGGQNRVLTGVIAPGTPQSPVTTIITDSAVGDFLNPIPEVITVTGQATFGDGVTAGSINPDDFVVASIRISSPLEMIIDSTVIEGEFEDTEMDLDDNIVNALKVAIFNATVGNHLPVGVSVELLLSPDSASLYVASHPDVVSLGPITVTAGNLNPDGTVASASVSENTIVLDSIDLQILKSDTLWMGQLITMLGTNGQTVKMSPTDSLHIHGYLEVDVTVSEDLFEDDDE